MYRDVFRGPPWFEDFACSNESCKAQFTEDTQLKDYDRENVFLINQKLERCPLCEEKLELVDFYPNIVDQKKLINEAVDLKGFVGYLLKLENKLVGFSWGYKIPGERTESVNFPKIRKIFDKKFINPGEIFYCAETGIVGDYQNKGFGSLLVAKRMSKLEDLNVKYVVNRTINPYMKKIMEKVFSDKEGEQLFEDPEKGTPWFMWKSKDINKKYVNELSERFK